MDLTVVICTYNRSRMLLGNLIRLKGQITSPELKWEVVIIDNNCTDDTAEIVRQAAGQFSRRVAACRGKQARSL